MPKYLRNRHAVLLLTLAVYILTIVVEGAVTDRATGTYSFENPYFDLRLQDWEGFKERRED